MDGIFHESQDFLDYCWQLLLEYSILDSAQLFGILKIHGKLKKRAREKLMRQIRHRGLTRRMEIGNRIYFAKHPQIKPEGRYMAQIRCFWVLLQYIDRVDSHHAASTFRGISMEIEGRDYDIVYVPKGAEKLCNVQKRRGGDLRYFIVVEDMSQIPLIEAEKVHSYATVSDEGQVDFYTAE